MGKLNSRQLEIARNLCLARDGYNCQGCGLSLNKLNTIVNVHHKDGNRENNPIGGSNWELLCHPCNIEKWHRQKYETVIETGEPNAITLRIGSKMEYQFVRWLRATIIKNMKVTHDYAIYTGALEIDGSPETTKRYLRKHLQDSKHHKAMFKTVFINFETFIKLSDSAQKALDEGI